jgi:amino acid adenylation domain-containing protein/non-ribosomal peptide synthase protein (TIGR01720 family)
MTDSVAASFPLSFAQQQLWFLQRLDPAMTAYNLPRVFRLHGVPDADALERAFRALIQRHAVLRTRFHEQQGVPQQTILDAFDFHLAQQDLRALPEAEKKAALELSVRDIVSHVFDLGAPPLVRARLLRTGEHDSVLAVCFHHIASDAWSNPIVAADLASAYQLALTTSGDVTLPAPPVQYAELARQQREAADSGALDNVLEYWQQHLGDDVPALDIPTDYPRPAVQTFRGALMPFEVSPELAAGLQQFCRAEQCTPFVPLLAAWQLLLARLSGQTDFAVGVPAAGRDDEATQQLVGYFVTTQVFRARVTPQRTLRELCRQVRADALGALAHPGLPFELLLEKRRPARDAARSPIFQSLFSLQVRDGGEQFALGDLRAELVPVAEHTAKFELSLDVVLGPAGAEAVIEYNTDLFSTGTIERVRAAYERVLSTLIDAPDMRVGELALPAPERLSQLVEWGTGQHDTLPRGVTDLIAQQVQAQPDAIAVRQGDTVLTYAEVWRASGALAATLNAERIGVSAPASPQRLVAMLAVLRAGAALVPLDPAYPAARLAHMMRAANIGQLLAPAEIAGQLDVPPSVTVLAMQADSDTDDAPATRLHAQRLAYLIFTSGSTGLPKPVAVAHGALSQHIQAVAARYALSAQDTVLAAASFGFDAALEQWLAPLSAGASVVLPGQPVLTPEHLTGLVREQGVTVLDLPPALLRQLCALLPDASLPVRLCITGGEACTRDDLLAAQRVFTPQHLANAYGPTEAVISPVVWLGDGVPEGVPPIGQPVGARRVWVLDAWLNPVPPGLPGELYLGGALAREYAGQGALTASRFIADPFSTQGGRLYRTGDRVRWRADGTLDYLGRVDAQLSLRGFRIEPGEIETALLAQPSVQEAVVAVRGNRLLAWVVGDARATDSDLRAALAEQLPDYMVPAAILPLAALPLTVNGKLDRAALPDPAQPRADNDAPATEQEHALAAVWCAVLGVPAVGREDNFFALGGDSILSLQIVARLRDAGWQATPRQIFERQTLASQAAVLTPVTQAAASDTEGSVPLLPIQADFFRMALPNPAHWNQAILLHADTVPDEQALRAALAALVQHHDSLRLRYHRDEQGMWQQRYTLPMPDEHLLVIANTTAEEITGVCDRVQRQFDLTRGPLLRAVLMYVSDGSVRLLLLAHHLVVDAVSWRILVEDLHTAMQQHGEGASIRLPEKSGSYKDWSLFLHDYFDNSQKAAEPWAALRQHLPPALPCDHPQGGNLAAQQAVEDIRLDTAQTQALLRDAPAAYRTQVNDLLLTALGRALCHWSGQPRVLVDMESHGRHPLPGAPDLSRTVGWFTSLHPVLLSPMGEPGEALCRVKESLRQVPQHGLGAGFAQPPVPRAGVLFNYLGQFDNSQQADSVWRLASESSGRSVSDDAPQWHEFVINGQVLGGELRFAVRYSRARYQAATVRAWAARFADELRALIGHCTSGARGATASDFPLAQLDQHALARLPVPAADMADLYPLSPMQQGLLFHSLYAPQDSAYLNQMRMDITDLDVPRFRRAWQTVLARHDALRSGFIAQGDAALQWVAPEVALPLTEYSDIEPEALATQERERGVDLLTPPLMRLAMVRTGARRHHLIWTCHHLLLDGWSSAQLLGEVLRIYAGESLPAVAHRYRDYIAWLGERDADASERHWRGLLSRAEQPTLLAEVLAPRTARTASQAVLHQPLPAALSQSLQQVARARQLTLNTLVQATWALLVARYSGQRTVTFGATVSGRPAELPGSADMVGLFINTLPVVVDTDPAQPLDAWLHALQAQHLASREHEHTPLYAIQRWAGQGGQSLFDTLVVFENFPVDALLHKHDSVLACDNVQSDSGNHYPLTLRVKPGDALHLDFLHDPARVDDVQAVADEYRALLTQVCTSLEQSPATALGEVLPGAGQTERHTQRWPHQDVLSLWHAQVARVPSQIAVASGTQQLSYAALAQRSDALAARLLASGVQPEQRVGVHARRGIELVTGLLAVLKAGAVYVPLDPDLPADRLAWQAQDAGLHTILTASPLGFVPQVPVLSLLQTTDDTHDLPAVALHPEQGAYLIYTSGSTGRPKGVLVSHGALANYVQGLLATLALPEAARTFAMVSTVAADLGHTVLFGALCDGRTLHLVPPQDAFEPDRFADYLHRHQVDVLKIVPGHLEALLSAAAAEQVLPRHTLIIGGEAARQTLLDRVAALAPARRIVNHYGPTETTVGTLMATRTDAQPAPLPLGAPLPNTDAWVLDAALQPVPPGADGELYLGGAALARGYLGQPALTAARFVAHPFRDGERLYRTGDRVHRAADGALRYRGRTDDQIKIRGYRVELSEVTARLRALPNVAQAAVIAREQDDGRLQLLGYVVPEQDTAPLMQALAEALPDYMCPTALLALPALPLTANGKLDRQALPLPGDVPAQHYAAPENDIEKNIAEVWAEVLRREQIGRLDNFFELGGDSILSLQIVARCRKRGLRITPKQLMERQTVAAVAEVAVPVGAAPVTPLRPRVQHAPLLPVQQWFFAQDFPTPAHWNQSVMLVPDDTVTADVAERAIAALVQTHPALRMQFLRDGDTWRQRVQENPDGIFQQTAFAHLDDITPLADQAQRSLRLDLPFRACWLAQTDGAARRLLLIAHHLVVDGVSWRILLEDLQTACSQLLNGEAVALLPETTTLTDWPAMLRQQMPHFRQQSAFWQAQCAHADTPFPATTPAGSNTVADMATREAALDANTTRALLGSAHRAWRTRPDDLLLTALARTLCAWTGDTRLLVELEGHGREALEADTDLSRTVGWFTSLYPVALTLPDGDALAQLRAVKEQLRAVPDKGLGFGVLKYLDNRLQDGAAPQITFNYLGQFDQTAEQAALWRQAPESAGQARAPDSRRRSSFDLSAQVSNGQLHLSWAYSRARHDADTMDTLLATFCTTLAELVCSCEDSAAGATPSDFPLAALDQPALDRLPVASGDMADLYPLSPLQQGLLFHSLYAPSGSAYLNQLRLDIDGLDVNRFRAAWQAVMTRHPVLRTGFITGQGEPLQWVARESVLPLTEMDVAQAGDCDALAAQELARGFDLLAPPLMRLLLVRTDAHRHHLIWTSHHLLLDGWSTALLMGEVLQHYRGEALSPAGDYRDYIAWLQHRDPARSEQFWRGELARIDSPTLLADTMQGDGNGQGVLQSHRPSDALEQMARRERVTLNTLVQGAWALLLAQCTGQHNVTFGATVAGRPAELPGAERTIGLFINTLPVIATLDPAMTVADWLRALQQQNLATREFEHTPLYDLQRWAGQGALFDTLLVFENYPVDSALRDALPDGLRFGDSHKREETHYGVTLAVHQDDGLHLHLSHDRARIGDPAAQALMSQLVALIEQLAQSAATPLGALHWLPGAVHAQLESWSRNSARFDDVVPVHQRIAQQAAAQPEACALCWGDVQISYRDLNTRANQLAHYLIAQGVRPDTPVGVAMLRAPEMVIALLAVMKAGGAYVPLDPEYPRERLAWMIEDSGINLLLTQATVAPMLPVPDAVTVLAVDVLALNTSSCDPSVPLQGDSLAYVIYTSGSTGKPKGAGNRHRALDNRIRWMQGACPIDHTDTVLQKTPFSFDVSVWEFFWPLMQGARLAIAAPGEHRDPAALAALIHRHQVSTLHFVPSMLQAFLTGADLSHCGSLRQILCSGEALPAAVQDQVLQRLPQVALHNLYGPTEAAIDVTHWRCRDEQGAAVPIGAPITDTDTWVLDDALNPVAPGVPGELYLGGAGLARGYHCRAALTAERFVASPFAQQGQRLYRTGDLVRWRADGVLEYLGRLDHQVKLRGLRIELGEIEAALLAQPAIQAAVVVAVPVQGEPQLVAYIVAEDVPPTGALRDALAEHLPDYMVPAFFVPLPALPLSPNGKVDRRALPAPALPETTHGEPPQGETETTLSSIWCALLGRERVARTDHFFELGGHSLMALKLQMRVQEQCAVTLPLRACFDHPTLCALAAEIDRLRDEGKDRTQDLDSMMALLDTLE